MKKVLVSPGYGAGWSTWGEGKKQAEYQPVIDFLESGGKFVEKTFGSYDRNAPAYESFEEPGRSVLKQMFEDFGADYVCVLGAHQLVVETVSGPYRIDEYDGSESLVEADNQEWW